MLPKEQNELMCRTNADTPMGRALRRFWIPVMQSSDLPAPDCDPFPLEIMGDTFVAFRNTEGKVGILDEFCAHRRVSLVIGRCEGNGIRCLYHGWKFAVDGSVLETPNVNDPEFKTRVRTKAYPVREAGGLIWAYFGPAEQEPAFPHHSWFDVPASNRLNAYAVNNCNYVQVFEALVDSSHLNILHHDGLATSGNLKDLNFAAAAQMAFDAAPRIEVDDTDFGFHYAALRGGLDEGQDTHVRVTAVLAPFMVANPNEDLWMFTVPVNDERSIHFHVWAHPDRKMGEEPLASNMLKHVGLDQEALRNYCLTWDTVDSPNRPSRKNHFGQNREWLKQGKFSGYHSFTQEDAAVNVSSGGLKDRSREMLAPVDAAVARYYRMLINMAQGAEAGKDPVGLDADPQQIIGRNTSVPYGTDWRSVVPGHKVLQRHRSPKAETRAPQQAMGFTPAAE
jgi:Phenylpropionate dioxygenase and related ring-hydroxylating dioxygenases, large terminal subunit